MIQISDHIQIDESDIQWDFVRAAGPGGQNVNKVASAAVLRFNVETCRALPERVRSRLKKIAGRRLSADGHLIIKAGRFRSQLQNRQDALQRLIVLIQRALAAPKPRRRTRPTPASRERRLAAKQHRGRIKQFRARVGRGE